MRICLFEDRRAADLAPLTLTRPAFDLLAGLSSLADKHRRHFAPDAVGYLVRPLVADLVRETRPHAPVNDPVWLRAGPTVLVNGRWVPAAGGAPPTTDGLFAGGPFVAVCDGAPAFAAVGPDELAAVTPAALDDCLADWLGTLPVREVGGWVVGRPADLVARNGAQIAADFPALADPGVLGFRPAAVGLVGPADRLFVDPGAAVDPMVVADTTGGPVVVAQGAAVAAFTRLEGPCLVGPGARVLGARVRAGTTIGPGCRVGGEVDASVLHGAVDKPHDGLVSHAYVGEWAALAAGSQVGGAVGDHAAVGPGVVVDRAAVVGPFAGLEPTGRVAPGAVPGFARHGPDGWAEAPLDAVLAAAAARMGGLSRAQEAVYRAAAAQTAAARRRVVGAAGDEPGRGRRTG